MNTNVSHTDFIYSVTFDPPVVWTVGIATVLIISIVLFIRARKRRTY